MKSVMVEKKMKDKIESLIEYAENAYSIKFTDLEDTFWFGDIDRLQEFLNQVSRERYHTEVSKGYFLYRNEHDETFKYYVESNRGTLILLKEELI